MKIGDRVRMIQGLSSFYAVGDEGVIVRYDDTDDTFMVKFDPSDTVKNSEGREWWCSSNRLKVIGE